jgi:psiF repeat-containing protein
MEGIMKFVVSKSVVSKSLISATILCFVISTGAAFAQTPAGPTMPAAPPAPAKIAKPKLSPDEKKKVSQACSAQANEKNLHGKDRRTFRATCIRHASGAPTRQSS